MRAMILAAGHGKRMGVLTEQTPKPLLKVAGRYLIEYPIESLTRAGIREIVINVSYFKDQIMDALGTGSRYNAHFVYSEEEERLETGGGIVKALPLLGADPFIVISSDVITDYPLHQLVTRPLKLAHLVFVKNPSYHKQGDYCLNERNEVYCSSNDSWTFASIGIYCPELFMNREPVYCRLAHLWSDAIEKRQVTGECYAGLWYNVGTAEDLQEAEGDVQGFPSR